MSRVPASNKAFSGMISGYFGSLRGHWGAHGCPRGVQGGSGVPLYRILNPSQSLICAQFTQNLPFSGPLGLPLWSKSKHVGEFYLA